MNTNDIILILSECLTNTNVKNFSQIIKSILIVTGKITMFEI